MEIERTKFILDWGNRSTLSETKDIINNKQVEVEISFLLYSIKKVSDVA